MTIEAASAAIFAGP